MDAVLVITEEMHLHGRSASAGIAAAVKREAIC